MSVPTLSLRPTPHVVLAVLALASAVCATPAFGQGAPGSGQALALGAEVSGVLAGSDPQLPDGSVYHVWRIHGSVGEAFQVDMESGEFDAYLMLRNALGTVLARDDDSGGGTDACLRIVLPETGSYEVVANALQQGTFGRYTIRLSRPSGGEFKRGVVGTIRRGETVTGQLVATDDRLSDHSVFRGYGFQGSAGESVRIDMMSDSFDAYLILTDVYGNQLIRDDDSGGGRNARITYTLPYSGTFFVLANAYRQDQYGEYRLTIR
jgi:hypothetical protein